MLQTKTKTKIKNSRPLLSEIFKQEPLPSPETYYKISREIENLWERIAQKHPLTRRQSQLELSEGIYRTITHKKVSLYESGTGTGKTLAMLMAAAQYITEHKNGTVIIATTTKHLQKQMLEEFQKYISAVNSKIKIAIIKGCLNYIDYHALKEEIIATNNEHTKALLTKLKREADAVNGDKDLIPAWLVEELANEGISLDTLLINGTDISEEALHYYNKAKAAAQNANIVITNHAMFVYNNWFKLTRDDKERVRSSLAQAVAERVRITVERFPFAFDNVIIDEAHQIEYNTLHALSMKVSFTGILSILKKLIIALKSCNAGKDLQALSKHLKTMTDIVNRIKQYAYKTDKDIIPLLPETITNEDMLEYKLTKDIESAHKTLSECVKITQKYNSQLSKLNAAGLLKKLGYMYRNIDDAYQMTKVEVKDNKVIKATNADKYGTCFFVKYSEMEKLPYLLIMPSYAGNKLGVISSLYNSLIMLSGTLTDSSGRFDSFKERNMKQILKHKDIAEERVLTGYDLKKMVNVYLYPNNPYPKDAKNGYSREYLLDHYLPHIVKQINEIIKTAKKGVLILTNAHYETHRIANLIKHKTKPIISYSTHTNETLYECIQKFKKSKGVFVTASAWTGVDIPDTISTLIITRLPYQSPHTPFYLAKSIARKRWADEVGKPIDGAHSYPALSYDMFIKLLQGMGRPIRIETDKADIHILDPRADQYEKVFEKTYNVIRKIR